jgi:lysine biosynthesis protein LysW
MVMAICPACEAQINIQGQVEMGQSVVCPQCAEDLEVIDIDPLELDWAYEELDWDGDEDDEDDDTF